MSMRVFGIILNAGQLAAALSAIGVFLFGCWKCYRALKKMSDKITKTYLSVGEINGDGKTIAENVKATKRLADATMARLDEFAVWRGAIDRRLDNQDRILDEQTTELAAVAVTLDALLKKSGQ